MSIRKKICFIISVPHAKCDEENYPISETHVCDLAAPRAAAVLSNRLRDVLGRARFPRDVAFEVVGPIYGNVNRMATDLNRMGSRATAFRKRIIGEIARRVDAGELVIMLDVHSFDGNAPWSEHGASIVFMDEETVKRRHEPYARESGTSGPVYTEEGKRSPGGFLEELCDRLERIDGSMRVLISRSPVNDIVRQAKEVGAKAAVLIEFDEDTVAGKKGAGVFQRVISDLVNVLIESALDK